MCKKLQKSRLRDSEHTSSRQAGIVQAAKVLTHGGKTTGGLQTNFEVDNSVRPAKDVMNIKIVFVEEMSPTPALVSKSRLLKQG